MDTRDNPYSPGAGLRPPALVGRESELDAFRVLVARAAQGRVGRGLMLSGLRGVGKTVLLSEMRGIAAAADWYVVAIEAGKGDRNEDVIRRRLAVELTGLSRRLSRRRADRIKRALTSISSFSATAGLGGVSVGVTRDRRGNHAGDFAVDFPDLVDDLAEAAADDGVAFCVFIDELQEIDTASAQVLLMTQHRCAQRDQPFYVVGAGLPNLPARLAEIQSYAERMFDYRTVGPLPAEQAALALTIPAGQQGVEFDTAATTLLVDESKGYPYFLQEFGEAMWNLAPQSPFTYADAQAAVPYGFAHLDDGFFRSRWERATPTERTFLAAMAHDGGSVSSSSQVAARLNRKPQGIGPVRKALISKGLIYAPEHGKIEFTVPGFADFIRRNSGYLGEESSWTQ